MKKMFFLAATAALALSSCSSDELVQAEQPVVEDGAVLFSAYQGRATRANNQATVDLAKDGFGVFAYEQGIADWDTYVTSYNVPNFMYNQRVDAFGNVTLALKNSITKAEYDALDSYKDYYAENDADENVYDKNGTTWTKPADAKAYAALKAGDKAVITASGADATLNWVYDPVKYFSNVEGAKHSFFAYAPWNPDVAVKFSTTGPKIHYNVNDNYDLLWGYETTTTDVKKPYTNLKKTDVGVTKKLGFTFDHMLTQVNVDISYFSDNVHNADHQHDANSSAKLAPGTKIIVRSVKLVGPIASEGDLDLATGKWAYTNVDESAFEVSNIVFVGGNPDDPNDGDKPDVAKSVFDHLKILPPMNNADVKIQVVYDVETLDNDDQTSLNSHIVTNTWESTSFKLLQGHSYDYQLHIGMTSVKFEAKVTNDWKDEVAEIKDLPEKNTTSSSNRR